MDEIPKQQPPKRGSNGFWIGAACLAVGYLVGQTASNSQKPVYADTASTPPPTLAQLTDPANNVSDVAPEAMDMNATAADETVTTDDEPEDASSDDAPPDASGTVYQTADASQPNTEGDETGQTTIIAGTSSEDTSGTGHQTSSSTQTYSSPGYSYSKPSSGYSGSSSNCEGLSCYGTISNVTGLPRTTYVHGYLRKNGTYVQPYYRSHRH